MWKTWLACVALAVAVVPAHAEADAKKKATKTVTVKKGFWKVLVKPKQKWVLRGDEAVTDTITIETYDVRKVGGAFVARLRWMHATAGGEHEDIGNTNAGKPTQIAVTDAGMYLLNAENDDARIVERLKGKPSRSDPPKPYDGTEKNQGRYLIVNDEGVVCMGEAPLAVDGGECEDVCDGWVCISPTKGVIELAGTYAPGYGSFMRSR